MKNHFRAVLLIILVLIPVFNVQSKSICLITDQYWNLILEQELSDNPLEKLRKGIFNSIPFLQNNNVIINRKVIKKNVVLMDTLTDDTAIIQDSIQNSDCDIVIFSPLLSDYAASIAEQFSEMVFIVLSSVPSEDYEENLFFVNIDYSKAFFDAGVWAATQDIDVQAVFMNAENKDFNAAETFKDGWKTLKPSEELDLLLLNTNEELDSDDFDSFESSFNDGEKIAAVFAGPYNESLLSKLDGHQAIILTERLQPWHSAGYNAAGSIEIGPVKMLTEIINFINIDTYKNGEVIEAEFFLYE